MKTLQQIEPRIDLQNAPASAVTTTNANYHFIITQPGSYYLSANLGVTKTNGIQINAEGVTLDLAGFEISRSSGSGGNGIEIAGTSHRASIRNGSVKGFSIGIQSLSAPSPRSCAFRDLAAANCTTAGIVAGQGAVLESCRAHDISGSVAIVASSGSSLANCSASNNTTFFGIFSGSGSSLTNCTASNNVTSGGPVIVVAQGSSATNCSAFNNTAETAIAAELGSTLTNCAASSNKATWGIFADAGSSLTNCTASNNTGNAPNSGGIETGGDCTLTHCIISNNTSTAPLTATTGMGISASANATIKDCVASFNRGNGIGAGGKSALSGCTSVSNGSVGGSGIAIGPQSTIANCIASGNRTHGFSVGETSTLLNCTASNNITGFGINGTNALSATNCTVSANNAGGITAGNGSHIQACTVYKNLGSGPTASAISVLDGSTVNGCTVRENNGDGIRFNGNCRIAENTCDFNGQNSVTGAGIHGLAGGSRVESNTVTGNFNVGLLMDAGGNTIFKNSARGNNTAPYTIAVGNDVGPISTAASATSAWANIVY